MGIESPLLVAEQPKSLQETQNEKAKELLSGAFPIDDIALKRFDSRDGGMKTVDLNHDLASVRNGSYNSNQGVMLIKYNDRFFALPDSADSMKILQEANFQQDGTMGVPNINNKELWTNPNGEAMTQWTAMVEKAIKTREQEQTPQE